MPVFVSSETGKRDKLTTSNDWNRSLTFSHSELVCQRRKQIIRRINFVTSRSNRVSRAHVSIPANINNDYK